MLKKINYDTFYENRLNITNYIEKLKLKSHELTIVKTN